MSSIAAFRDFGPHRARGPATTSASAPTHQSILRRIFAAIARSQQRRTEQEAARFIARHGGRLTDDIERQLGEHLNGRGFPRY